jgi:hypothetical protein
MEIQGLSPLQQDLADRIWACDSPESIRVFFSALPRSLVHEALVVYHMILWAAIDEEDLGDMWEAQDLINHVRNLPC